MNIIRKTYRALVDFQVGDAIFAAGDDVPANSPHLARLISFGGFVEETTPKGAKPASKE